jgi:hypothetical protein
MSARRTLRIALIGQGFMGCAHSNAYCQAPHFFEFPCDLRRQVICGRNLAALEPMAPPVAGRKRPPIDAP